MLTTLDKLFSEEISDDNSIACKFPARTQWLQEQLNITNLPKVICKEYNKWLKILDPTSATIIFSSAHINSPASMFGHTFLRIDTSFKSKLLSHAVNYSANANQNTENGFLFAIKGLFGGYFGQYSLLPYYDKLKEYRDTEQRDIWEYDLNLNKKEISKMVKHIWELKQAYSHYYFFDENCSYNMLWLLEVARPTVHLRENFTYHVSPPETIFAIEAAHLVKDKVYRASKRTVLLAYENTLNNQSINLVKQLSEDKISSTIIIQNNNIPKKEKQLILNASIELSEYNYIKRIINKKQYLTISHNLSKVRATLGKSKQIEIIQPVNPDKSHKQLKISLGYKYNNTEFITFGIRPTYHDITNNDEGFLKGTQIEFFNTQFIYNNTTKKIDIDFFNILTIKSIAQRTKFFNPLSWATQWKFDNDSLDNQLDFSTQVNAGLSWNIGEKSYTYTLLDFFITDYSYANSAVGASIGAVLYNNKKLKTNIEMSYRIFDSGDTQKKLHIIQSYYAKQNIDIKLKYKYIEKFDKNEHSTHIEFNYFF